MATWSAGTPAAGDTRSVTSTCPRTKDRERQVILMSQSFEVIFGYTEFEDSAGYRRDLVLKRGGGRGEKEEEEERRAEERT